jgi:peptide deformylase
MILPLLKSPDLRLHCHSIAVRDDEAGNFLINHFVPDMFETMYYHGAIGLAAIQVDCAARIFVMDTSKTGYPKSVGRRVFINPEILSVSRKREPFKEGCLSFPGVAMTVARPNSIQVQAVDENFEEFTLDLDGIDAICFQHELDHLNGITFDKYADPEERNVA